MIETRRLVYRYRSGVTLSLPDFRLEQGHALLLQGPSGSGKSTLLALACGLLAPIEGSITVAGQDIRQLQGQVRDAWRGRTIGFLPQRLFLSQALNVRDNLGLAYLASGLRRNDAHIARTLEALHIGDLASRKPAELSGGQAQRVALARASLLQPCVLLADEPTASLDDQAAQQAIAQLVQTAQRGRASLVIATHDARVPGVLEASFSPDLIRKITLEPASKLLSVL